MLCGFVAHACAVVKRAEFGSRRYDPDIEAAAMDGGPEDSAPTSPLRRRRPITRVTTTAATEPPSPSKRGISKTARCLDRGSSAPYRATDGPAHIHVGAAAPVGMHI